MHSIRAGAAFAPSLLLADPAAAQTRNFAVQGTSADGSTCTGRLVLQRDGAAS